MTTPSPSRSSSSTTATTTHLRPSSTFLIKPVHFPMSEPTNPKAKPPIPAVNSTPKPPSPPPPSSLRSPKLPFRPRKLPKLSPSTSSSAVSVAVPPPKRPQPPSPTRPLSAPGEIDAALTHLRTADPCLSTLIDLHQRPAFDAFQTPFLALTKSILYQQLAYKAGTSIYSRFVALCGGEAAILPSTILELSPPQLRQIGVSARKASYLHDLARKYQNGILSDKGILTLDDKSLFTMLTMVNGIGSWSVHMFMIFSLHRPDVLPVNDLQVRKGVQMLYGLEELPRPSKMEQLCERWRPYRSVGAWYMWRLVEAKGSASGSGSSNSVGNLRIVSLPHPRPEQQPTQSLPGPQQAQQTHFIDPINGIMNIGSNYAQLN